MVKSIFSKLEKPYIIAEAGINHNGKLQTAYNLEDVAKKNGANAIKFQTYDTKKRIGGTIASSLYSMMQGVQILRIHDVNELIQSIKVFKRLIKN